MSSKGELFTADQLEVIQTQLNDSSLTDGSGYLIDEGGADAEASFRAGVGISELGRVAYRFDLTGTSNPSINMGRHGPPDDLNYRIVYSVGARAAVNNRTYDMQSWTSLGVYTSDVGSANECDLTGVPKVAAGWIGIKQDDDYRNFLNQWDGLTEGEAGHGAIVTDVYDCP